MPCKTIYVSFESVLVDCFRQVSQYKKASGSMSPYNSPLYFLPNKILIALIAFLDTSHPTPRPTGLYLMDILVLRTCISRFYILFLAESLPY